MSWTSLLLLTGDDPPAATHVGGSSDWDSDAEEYDVKEELMTVDEHKAVEANDEVSATTTTYYQIDDEHVDDAVVYNSNIGNYFNESKNLVEEGPPPQLILAPSSSNSVSLISSEYHEKKEVPEIKVEEVLDLFSSHVDLRERVLGLVNECSTLLGRSAPKEADVLDKISLGISDLLNGSSHLDFGCAEELTKAIRIKDDARRFKNLSRAMNGFSSSAVRLTEIVISELNIPKGKKVLKPSSLGGVAGGMKYISK
jgi:hypothetical protein